ncbi:MAG: hypothetical protein ACYC0B_02495 [Gemmatimonadaceae bacterium]
MNIHRIMAAALVLVAACGGAASDESGAAADSAAAPTVAAGTQSEAQRAAAISNAINAAPMSTDSILAAHGLTADELQQMMLRVARDSAASAEYGRLTRP